MTARGTLLVVLVGAGVGLAIPAGVRTAGGGDLETGRAVFANKQCARCHRPAAEHASAPALEAIRRPQGELELAGRLWNHVPAMLAAIGRQGAEWPSISSQEMGSLMAYLLADPGRDPAPDLSRGQTALVRKGCLKCHSLRGEGGQLRPDLAERRADYESATAWATAMWTHTPRMLAVATSQGIPYPRFTGDEMGDLLGFLRSTVRGGAPSR